jgi:DNA (cytosine-5)-methyltransferase 1
MPTKKEITFIDLFAGCGGLSLGALKAGFSGILSVERQKNAFDTFKHNLIDNTSLNSYGLKGFIWPRSVEKKEYEINEFIDNNPNFFKRYVNKIDLIVGGPPCQGFSSAGKRIHDDPRNQLYKSYIKFIRKINPKIILIENVSGIASKFSESSKSYKEKIINELSKDFYIDGQILNSELFGVPQKRKRYFIIGFNKKVAKFKDIDILSVFDKIRNDAIQFKKHYTIGNKTWNLNDINAFDAISDLSGNDGKDKRIFFSDENSKYKDYKSYNYNKPLSDYQKMMRYGLSNDGQIDSHRIGDLKTETQSIYKNLIKIVKKKPLNSSGKVSKDDMTLSGWKSKKLIIHVLRSNNLSPTLTTCPFDYIHYSSPRILTAREFARLQSFPDWFNFKGIYATSGSKSYTTPRYSQIGNAVPPLMAESILKTLKTFI